MTSLSPLRLTRTQAELLLFKLQLIADTVSQHQAKKRAEAEQRQRRQQP